MTKDPKPIAQEGERASAATVENSASTEWPRWWRQQVVEAVRITAVQIQDDGSAKLRLKSCPTVTLSSAEVDELIPVPGHWFIRQQDGVRVVMPDSLFRTTHREFK